MQTAISDKQKVAKFTDLVALQKSHLLAVDIYRASKLFPTEEMFGLTNQLRRAAISIPSNIAEGFSRPTKPDKIHFYSMSLGSLTEVQSQLLLARDIGYLEGRVANAIAVQTVTVHKLIYGLVKSLKEGKGVK